MKMKEVNAIFEKQPARKLIRIKKGEEKKDEVVRIGTVWYKVCMTCEEYAESVGGISAHRWSKLPENGVEKVSSISRQYLKLFKKMTHVGFTGAGFPIFHTKKYIKANK